MNYSMWRHGPLAVSKGRAENVPAREWCRGRTHLSSVSHRLLFYCVVFEDAAEGLASEGSCLQMDFRASIAT